MNSDPDSLRRKALGELPGDSIEIKLAASRTVLEMLLPVLDEWANGNGLQRLDVRFGTTIRTQWFSTSMHTHNPPIDSVELLLAHVLPAQFPPLAKLVHSAFHDTDLGFRMILASLILQEIESNNIDGAVMAADSLDRGTGRTRSLAEKLLIRNENLKQHAAAATKANFRRGQFTVEKVCNCYDKLIAEGKSRRRISKSIAKELKSTGDTRLDISLNRINRILRKHRPIKK